MLAAFGHYFSTVGVLVATEKTILDLLLPTWSSLLEKFFAEKGRFMGVSALLGVAGSIGFFGFGTLFAIPAFAGAKYGKIQKNRTLDVGTFLACAPNIIVNLIAGSAFGSFLMAKGLPDSAFDWRALPSTSTLMKEAAVWVAANEVIFFYTHRWMHINKYLYAKIHKIHHTWTSPISFTAAYSHPLEVLLGNVVPLAAGPLLCGSHIMGACIWFFFYQVHTTCTHSGYWICDDHGLHDVHHAKFNYNYGVHGIMDHIYGTHLLPEEDKKQTQ